MNRYVVFAIGLMSVLTGGQKVLAATATSQNFVVTAPDQKLAEEFAQLAEHYRKEKAREWLGREMEPWRERCPLKVQVTNEGAGGQTNFEFFPNQIRQSMFIKGSLNRLKESVLPHEVTHTVFAYHFRRPVPRWADEGGSVLSEDDLERSRHDKLCRQLLNQGRGFKLRMLFSLTEYPNDVMVLYAEGYSITRYLVELKDRKTFLNFVAMGMDREVGWEAAAKRVYGFESVEKLEEAWISHLRKGTNVARNDQPPSDNRAINSSALTSRMEIRQNDPPTRPILDPSPTARGSSPDQTFEWNNQPTSASRPILPTNSKPVVELSAPTPPPVRGVPPVTLFPPEPSFLRNNR